MNLTDFINTKIKKGVSEYNYFEITKTNPTEYKKLLVYSLIKITKYLNEIISLQIGSCKVLLSQGR